MWIFWEVFLIFRICMVDRVSLSLNYTFKEKINPINQITFQTEGFVYNIILICVREVESRVHLAYFYSMLSNLKFPVIKKKLFVWLYKVFTFMNCFWFVIMKTKKSVDINFLFYVIFIGHFTFTDCDFQMMVVVCVFWSTKHKQRIRHCQ